MQRSWRINLTVLALTALVGTALAGGPAVAPFGTDDGKAPARTEVHAQKDLGDIHDLLAPALLGSDYLLGMQADITEDNAGNGDPDSPDDPDDGGWDWVSTVFSHGPDASAFNTYGVTALGLYWTYLQDPRPEHFITMRDAADGIIARTPAEVRSGPDVVFLLRFADLPGCPDPALYRAGAQAICDRHVTVYGSLTALAEAVRDSRAAQGYANGIIPWDIGPWAEAAVLMDLAFPGEGYAAEAAAIAEVLWLDSFDASPGHFQPFGPNQGYDPAWSTSEYWWYNLGLTGLIRAFVTTGTHLDEIPALQAALVDGQYPDGSFSDQYGAQGGDADLQTTAYAVATIARLLDDTAANGAAVGAGARWLAATQDAATGAWLDTSGEHNTEVGGESTAALALALDSVTPTIGATVDGGDPVACGVTKTVTVSYTPAAGTPGLRGYEMTVAISGGVLLDTTQPDDLDGDGFIEENGLEDVEPTDAQFFVQDHGDGTYTVTSAILGATDGLQTAGDLFSVALLTDSSGPVTFDVTALELRDPDNQEIFADIDAAVGFTVDCEMPAAVTGITTAPGHDRVQVSWSHDGADVASYAVFRGLWYDTTPGVSAYPEYDDLAGSVTPTRPADHAAAVASAEWELAGTVTAGEPLEFTDSWPDASARGIYYYEVFAVDAAANGSAAAPANDRATNYWLGDIDADGDVDVLDIDALGDSFGLCDDTPGAVDDDWNDDAVIDNVIDVGPTDDVSRVGIPTTDSCVEFEDLMIFAMNFSVVDGRKTLPAIADVATLAWRQVDATHWALQLTGSQGLQALRIQAATSAGAIRSVTAGPLLADQSGPVFLRNVGEALDANLAVFGEGFTGTGDLLVVETGEAITADQLVITARGLDNREVQVSFTAATGVELPSIYRLDQNHPNPFNPRTTIRFALPEAADVRLEVYGVDGRLVKTLVSEIREAGHHEVIWRGNDDAGRRVATGTYFYVIDAGDFHQVRKMTLMK